jgi:competence protein ComEA
MLKKLILALAMMVSVSFAFAAVDVNKADQAALDGIKGIGPTMSKAILAERKKHGDFTDWADLQTRVKGIGDKNSERFSEAGLMVNGASKPAAKRAKGKVSTSASTDKKDAMPARH